MPTQVAVADKITALSRKGRPFQKLGVELLEARPAYVKLALCVREDMLGGHDLCEGGVIFTLADLACVFACMTQHDETLTQGAHISFISPARLGERLIAEGVEVSRTRKTGIYDVSVKAENGRLIALFRGQCVTAPRKS